MSATKLLWRHITINTHGSWLHGDSRGFRSRDHRIHSSGDYKNPPPADEHEGLRRYHKARHPHPIEIPYRLRRLVAQTIAQVVVELNYPILIVTVSAKHAHVLAKLPLDLREFNRIIGLCKNRSSRAISRQLPGRVRARGDKHKLVRNRAHRKNVYLYLRDDQGPGAVAWCHKIVFDD